MKKFYLLTKTLLVATVLLMGGVNSALGNTLYERGTTNAWADADLSEWTQSWCTATISGGLSVTTKNAGWNCTKSISVTKNKVVTLNATLKTGGATGRSGSYDYIKIGGVKVGFNEQDKVAFVDIDGVSTNLTLSYNRSTAYSIHVVINQLTGAVSYTVGSASGSGLSSTAISDVVFGHYKASGEGYDINPVLQKIDISEEDYTLEVAKWDFTKATWSKDSGFGTSTITINSQSCTYATGALEGLALQGGSGTSWQVSSNGLREDNGTRSIAVLGLKASDMVVIETNTSGISGLVNGTSFNDTYTGTCIFTVTSDGAFGFKVERYTSSSTNAYTTSITVRRSGETYISEYNKIKDIAEALVAVPNDNAAATSTLSSAISTQNSAVASATTVSQVETAKSALKSAITAFVAAANPTAGNRFDITYMLTNPDVENITDWGDAADQGWYTDIPGSGLGTYNNFAARTNMNSGKNGIERYSSNVCTTANTYGLYQKVTLPVGIYSFTANALANTATTIVMAAGEAEGDAVTASDFTEYNVDFGQASNSEIKVGLKISETGTNTCNWMAITGLKLYKEAASVSATLGSNGFTTFASPYPLDLTSATQTAKGFTAYRAASIAGSTVTFKDDVNQNVVANTGILLKGTANATVTIPVVASGTALAGNSFHVNTSDDTFAAEDGCTYYGMIKDSDPLQFGTFDPASVAIPANKAYLKVNSSGELAARQIEAVFGDELTGISEAEAATKAAQKEGKFVVDGKLVIFKKGMKFNANGARIK